MVDLAPFRALRPVPARAAAVAAPPYDVVDVAEARALARDNPDCFLHVSRPEIDLPDDASPEEVQVQGARALASLVDRGVLVRDPSPGYSVYRQRRGSVTQTGVVGCASVADYRAGLVAVHEHTRRDKEEDRVAHVTALAAHDEPVFLMYATVPVIDALVAEVTAHPSDLELTDQDGVRHTLWIVADPDPVAAFEAAFAAVPRLYVADGHHRSAAAARLHDRRPEAEGSAWFPVVAFPVDQLTVLPYHRVVADLAGHDRDGLLAAVSARFTVQPVATAPEPARHRFGMYTADGWHLLTPRPGTVDEDDPIGRLDVSILQDGLLAPVLGIADPRADPRIGFVGGSRGTAELERLVDGGRFAVAFSLPPTSPTEVMAVADENRVMPPKSTWFDPKLASGLFVHPLV